MGWRRAEFKGKKVWVEVSADGEPVITDGRVPMRYSNKAGSKIYRAGATRIRLDDTATIEELDAGVSADKAPAANKKSGFGKAGTRTQAQKERAMAAAVERLGELSDDAIVVFTDGGCRGNPGPAGSGVHLRLPDGRTAEASKSLGRATNNIAELTAIELACDLLDEAGVAPGDAVHVFSDSKYSRGVLVQGWKAKANRELILSLRDRLQSRPGLVLEWVAGHVGVDGNERADALANAGIDGVTAVQWTESSS